MASNKKYIYDWPRPMVTADAVVFGLFDSAAPVRVLLIKRGRDPFKGKWAFPGGFVEMDEELEDAAARELAEETGLADLPLEQVHTFGKCGRDPRGRMITVTFTAVIHVRKGRFFAVGRNGAERAMPSARLRAGDDAACAKWFDIERLPAKEMAFDHVEVARLAIGRLRSKAAYRRHAGGRGGGKT
jgi:8-oxo-dGTP diphosphatase